MDRDLLNYNGAKRVLGLIALLTVLEGLCIVVQAVGLSEAVSRIFAGNALISAEKPALIFFLAVAGRYLCLLIIKILSNRFAERTSSETRQLFLTRLFKLGPGFVSRRGSGNLVTLALEGVGQMRQYLELFLPKLAANALLPLMIFGYVLFVDRISALILAVTYPVLIVFMILLGLAAQKKIDDRWESYRVLANHFLDSLRGLATLRYLGLSRKHAESIRRVSDKYRIMTMRTLRVAFLSSFALDFFSMLSIAFVAVFLGLRLINGAISLNPSLTVLILAPEFFLPIRELGQDYHATLDGKEAARKLRLYSASNPEHREEDETAAAPFEWNGQSRLEISGLTFSYSGEKSRALDGLSLHAAGFEKIGVIGFSGAGKSTLIHLIGGFSRPDFGNILINREAVRLNSSQWRNQVTYLPQRPYLFSGSLRENIAFYAPGATEEQVLKAAASAGLLPLVRSLPHGLNELIGAGARQLSGGQEQRVALARAFLCNRPILLLDEPTAHLDIETEYELKETMIRLFSGKLVFLATHRLHWMDQMDRVIVLQNGKIAESGTQEALLQQKGVYAGLVRTQLEGF